MLVVFGAAFELPLLVVMANFAGVLPARLLRKSQRIAIFLIFLFAAVATPSTDPFTMCAMADPDGGRCSRARCSFAVVHDRRKARAGRPRSDEQDLADDVPRPLRPDRVSRCHRASRSESAWSDST